MKPTEACRPKSSVPPHRLHRLHRLHRVPAPHPLSHCSCCCSCPDSEEQGRREGRGGARRKDAYWNRLRTALLALLYVVLLSGSWTQFVLAAAVPSRTDSDVTRRLPWTYESQPSPVTAPGPRGQQRRPSIERPRPRPPTAMPASTPTFATTATTAVSPRGRGFSQAGGMPGQAGGGGAGGGLWCASEDAGARAYAATTVFEGKARSRSSAGPGGSYFVTFVVQHVYKDAPLGVVGGGAVAAPPLRMRSQVRLQFVEPPVSPRPTPGPERPRAAARHVAQCEDLSRLAPSGPPAPVRSSIKSGNKFIVFADRVGPHNFTVRGTPVQRTRATVHAIRTVLCKNCVKPPVVWGLRDVTLRTRRRLKLVCRTQGTPLPAVLWYKDGLRVTVSRRVRIQHNRKKSALVIARVRPSDAGRYECKAVSVIGRQDSVSAAVSIQTDNRQDNTTTLWPLVGGRCPFEQYCLNGGTCTYYETIAELVCRCAEGFKGQRCENKDVINRTSMYRPLSYFCKLGVSNTYYC